MTQKHSNNVASRIDDNNINNKDNNLQHKIQLTLNNHKFINLNIPLVENLSVEIVFK